MSDETAIFQVDHAIFERWPDYVVGCVEMRGIDNSRACSAINEMLASAETEGQGRLAGVDLKDIPAVAVWRTAFANCGWTPSKYLSSIEALLKRVSRGQPLPRISPIVDLGNAVSIATQAPIGAHDLRMLEVGPLEVRLSHPDDRFLPMGDAPEELPDPGEIVYASGHSVRTRRWVWRQSREALIDASTTGVFFPIDGFLGATAEHVQRAITMLAATGRECLGAEVRSGTVDRKHPRFPAAI